MDIYSNEKKKITNDKKCDKLNITTNRKLHNAT